MEQAEVTYPTTQERARVVKIIGFGLPICAVITGCCICFSSTMPVPITNPTVLILALLFVLIPAKSIASVSTLQKIIAIYLFAIIVNKLSSQYFRVPLYHLNVSISFSTIVLSLLVAGYFVGRTNLSQTAQSGTRTSIMQGWVLAMVILAIHMVLLGMMLRCSYGYGYERDLAVLGNICLYLLLFVLLWRWLDVCRFRQIVGLILTLFYSVVIYTEVGL